MGSVGYDMNSTGVMGSDGVVTEIRKGIFHSLIFVRIYFWEVRALLLKS